MINKTRILHVVSSISISNGIMGVIMNYYRHLDKEKTQFDFLYFEKSLTTYENEITELGGRVYEIIAPNFSNIFLYTKYLSAEIDKFEYNYKIVHCHELVLLSLLYPSFKLNGVEHIIGHSHSVAYSYKPLKAVRNFILQLPLKKLINSYCSCSKASAEFWYGKKLLNAGKVKIIKNAIDCNKFTFDLNARMDIRKKLEVIDSFVVGHVGRFSVEKNQNFLIDIFNELSKSIPDARLLLVGEGNTFEEVRDKVKKLSLEKKVIFIGPSNQLDKLYQAMDIFVFPSISEGLGMAAIEAQIMGLNCVVSCSVTKEVDISNIRYMSLESSPEEWAKMIIRIKNENNTSKADIKKDDYCIDKQVENLEKYYSEISNQLK